MAKHEQVLVTERRVELLERKAEQNNKLRSALHEMVAASQCVVAAWERGDLAGAVRFLECASLAATELLEENTKAIGNQKMKTFNVILPLHLSFRIEANTEREALENVASYTREHSAPSYLEMARDIYALEPRIEED